MLAQEPRRQMVLSTEQGLEGPVLGRQKKKYFKNEQLGQVNPSTGRLRQENCSEFKTGLAHRIQGQAGLHSETLS